MPNRDKTCLPSFGPIVNLAPSYQIWRRNCKLEAQFASPESSPCTMAETKQELQVADSPGLATPISEQDWTNHEETQARRKCVSPYEEAKNTI